MFRLAFNLIFDPKVFKIWLSLKFVVAFMLVHSLSV